MRPLVVVGDALLDRDVTGTVERLCPDAPVPVVEETGIRSRPGGAGLAAALAAGDGRPVTLVTALADDGPGGELRALLDGAGVRVIDLGRPGQTLEKVRIAAVGRSLLRLDRGVAGAPGPAGAAVRAALEWAGAVLVSDYGHGVAGEPTVRALLDLCAPPVVWDPHPKGPPPLPGAAAVTPNHAEALAFAGRADGTPPSPDPRAIGALAAQLARAWQARAVCVTCGSRGAVAAGPRGATFAVPAPPAPGGDPCGAGDRFAASMAGALADGADVAEAMALAVDAASRFVAAGGALAGADRPPPASGAAEAEAAEAEAVVAATRAQGGVVVATGGCFDLLHPGHIATLEAARALGDCLVVLANSDASVRRRKGEGRPVVGAADRVAVLRALRCVDAVLVFDDDTPAAALERLRPDVWAKGGDYRAEDLPEAATLDRWGGQVVVLPFLAGRSTTRLIEEAAIRVV